MATKELYIIFDTQQGMVQQMNFILARIADRLDKAEGNRGSAEVDSNITIEGNVATKKKQVSTDYTITDTDSVIEVDTTAQAVTITMSTSRLAFGALRIQDVGGNATTNKISIVQGGSETMNGKTTIELFEEYKAIDFIPDGENWFF